MADGRRRSWAPVRRAGLELVAAMMLGGCIAEGPVVQRASLDRTAILADVDSRSTGATLRLADGTVLEADASALMTADPRPGDLLLIGSGPTWYASVPVDGTARDGPCYRVPGAAELDRGSIWLSVRRDSLRVVLFPVVAAPGWDEKAGSDSVFPGTSTCLDAEGRAVSRR